MSYSINSYVASGSQTQFAVTFPYLDKTHVEVRLNSVLTTAYTWASSGVIQLNTAPASGVVVDIRRNTPKTARLVDFQDASTLIERDLDNDSNQMFYLSQEAFDAVLDNISLDTDGVFDAKTKRIKNVVDPVNPQDAVTKNWAETAMTSQLSQAIAKATAAATSATNAASSATAAAASATASAASASTSSTQADISTTKASEASSSAAAALSSKNAAALSETNAATSATQAASSASAASGSASSANTSAVGAAASAVSAANSAAAAATALDNFDDRYLGQKTADPTLDNDGMALLTGALYFNTTTGKMRVYTGSGWIDASSASVATLATFNYVATAGQTTFSGNDAAGVNLVYTVGALIVTLNGIDQKNGVDYTASNGSSIVLTSGAAAGDELRVYAFGNFLVADTYSQAAADSLLAQKLDKAGGTVTGDLTLGGELVKDGLVLTNKLLSDEYNWLHNGRFNIWQRYGSNINLGGGNQYPFDRWRTFVSGTVNFSMNGQGNGNTYLVWQASSANSYAQPHQFLEPSDVYSLRGKTVTFSFYYGGSPDFVGTLQAEVAYNPTSGSSSAGGWTTIAGVVYRSSASAFGPLVEAVFTVPDNAQGLVVKIIPTNTQPLSAAVGITNARLTLGTKVPKDFSAGARTFHQELEICKRYFEKSYAYDVPVGTAGQQYTARQFVSLNGSDFYTLGHVDFSVEKYTTPSIILFNPVNGVGSQMYSVQDGASTGAGAEWVSTTAIGHIVCTSGNMTGNRIYGIHYRAESEV